MDLWRPLFSWGRVTPSLRGTPQHNPLWTWFSGCTRWRETRKYELMISPLHPDIRYCTPQSRNTHSLWFTIPINHLRRLISYGFQFPPGHICIDQLQVSGCARRHSLWHWEMALRVCVCVSGHSGGICAYAAFLFAVALWHKSLSVSNNIWKCQSCAGERGLEIL